MKSFILLFLLLLATLTVKSQINQINIGLGRADQWGTASYTYVGDTAIGYNSQRSMDSRTMYMVSMDHSIGKVQIYQILAFSVMFPEYSLLYPGGLLLYNNQQLFMKAPTFDYSINTSLLKPTKRLTLYGGFNFRLQWALERGFSPNLDKWLLDWNLDGSNSFVPITMGINLNLRYQTRWLRIEFGYIGDVTSTSRDFEHNGQTVNMAPVRMQKIYLVLSGPIFRREKPPKKIKKKDFIKN